MSSGARDPRLQLPSMTDNPAFVSNTGDEAARISELQELRLANADLKQSMDQLTALVSTALAGRPPLQGEVLAADPANPFPRPLTHSSLALPGAEWAPLVPPELDLELELDLDLELDLESRFSRLYWRVPVQPSH